MQFVTLPAERPLAGDDRVFIPPRCGQFTRSCRTGSAHRILKSCPKGAAPCSTAEKSASSLTNLSACRPALDIVTETAGSRNANDALLVALQREHTIDTLATFDRGFEKVADFTLTSYYCRERQAVGPSAARGALGRRVRR